MAFIDQMRTQGCAVESILEVLAEQGLKIAARTYRSWKAPGRKVADRTVTDAQVLDAIRDAVWKTDANGRRRMQPEGLYGRRKMTAFIRRTIAAASWGAVDRAMRSLGLSGATRTKTIRTTIPAKDGIRAGDLLNRDFTACAPNRAWVTDFTYVRTWTGWVYVALIIDVFSKAIVGWNVQTTRDVTLVTTALRMAVWQRERQGHPIEYQTLVHHSDAGSQYTSITYTERLSLEGILPSIGTVGDAYDNAMAETVMGLFKSECIRTTIFHTSPYREASDVEYATASWVDWYNNRRLHGTLGMLTPTEYEQIHYAVQTEQFQPA